MNAILMATDNSSDMKRIVEFAKNLKAKTQKVDMDDMEDMELLKVMEVNRKNDYVSESDIMAAIGKQKKALANGSEI